MSELAEQLQAFSQSGLWVFSLVFLRIGAAMALLPAFGEQVTPMRVKLSAALAFTIIVAPVVWGDFEQALQANSWWSLMFTEVVAGFAIGIMFRLMVIALQVAGAVAANATSLSQMFGGGIGTEPQPAISTLLVVAGLCLAVMAGLHIRVCEALILSFQLFQPGGRIGPSDMATWGISRVAHAFEHGLTLAGPFVLASLIYNLALGAINRAMPQLMVAFVGAPAISLGGLVLLLVTAPFILGVWVSVFLDMTDLQSGSL
ncbi:flagellar biosynthetic protein FliR [uncultured Litoreibacter sp.]|uniref:flagellar biosynthetic protein FliR n=1 Tax=uncultured Litoreibacter sp. TaxID=1392394 RepID=UPI00262C3007|nr:flagellar biosynthetic protein FliR [uncultured Litoreibacter sp.]